MKKIPTLFQRDFEGDHNLVLRGEPLVDLTGAAATRKFDGTCCLVRDGKLYKRYDAKQGRTPPAGFELVEDDPTTGHKVGWLPVGKGPEDKWHRVPEIPKEDGTYELCGPHVNGNNENLYELVFLMHGDVELLDVPTDYYGIKTYFLSHFMEGIVWWRDCVPIAKIKSRDFGMSWPSLLPAVLITPAT